MMRNLILIFAIGALAAAQTVPVRPEFGQGLKENAEKLKQYTWKRRLDINVKGHSVERLEMVHYVDGKMETVPLDTPQRPAAPQGRGLRGMIMQKEIGKKKEEMKKEVEQLRGLLEQYAPGSASMRSALENAKISREGESAAATIRMEASGVVQRGDSFTLIWNVAARRPQKIEIKSSLDKKPVQMTIEYASLPAGPFYPAHTTLSAPEKNLNVAIDAFDYTRSASAP